MMDYSGFAPTSDSSSGAMPNPFALQAANLTFASASIASNGNANSSCAYNNPGEHQAGLYGQYGNPYGQLSVGNAKYGVRVRWSLSEFRSLSQPPQGMIASVTNCSTGIPNNSTGYRATPESLHAFFTAGIPYKIYPNSASFLPNNCDVVRGAQNSNTSALMAGLPTTSIMGMLLKVVMNIFRRFMWDDELQPEWTTKTTANTNDLYFHAIEGARTRVHGIPLSG